MPQARKYATPAARQAAYRARVREAQQAALSARGLPAIPTMPGFWTDHFACESAFTFGANHCSDSSEYAGYVPLAELGARRLFEGISERLDRLTDRAHIIQTGSVSLRLRRTLQRHQTERATSEASRDASGEAR